MREDRNPALVSSRLVIHEDQGLLNGNGIFIWSDGTSYKGDWRSNERFGFGIYEWPEGSKYEGNWMNDLWFGDGIYTNKYGIKFKGKWQDNLLLPGLVEVEEPPKAILLNGNYLNKPPMSRKYKGNLEGDPRIVDVLDTIEKIEDFKSRHFYKWEN
jgi:hypothetical protein